MDDGGGGGMDDDVAAMSRSRRPWTAVAAARKYSLDGTAATASVAAWLDDNIDASTTTTAADRRRPSGDELQSMSNDASPLVGSGGSRWDQAVGGGRTQRRGLDSDEVRLDIACKF
jgi:hypothetical protein